jgi:1-deoxy-D-xylulose-5-phosphate reductoisomerase
MATAAAVDRLTQNGAAAGTLIAGTGRDGLVAVASHPDVDLVLCASAGTEGLEAVLAAIDHGKTIALANKEVLVMAGGIVTEAARRRGVPILPVDSEHNAIHQCLHGRAAGDVARLILTASGGPFRGRSAAALANVSAADALKHPTWRMGRKITIDSATLMNKGLEVIEAYWLFGVDASRIDVVVHPQSVVHSMVELTDGSIIAQLGVTDMRLPIQYACSYPERWAAPVPSLNLTQAGPLEFAAPDTDAFPCLRLAYRALGADKRGTAPFPGPEKGPYPFWGSVPVVLNAANELAVAWFLEGRIGFTSIAHVIERTMDAHVPAEVSTLAEVRAVDAWARASAQEIARGLELKVRT